LLATNGAVERKAFAGQGELNPIGDRERSDNGPNLHGYFVPTSGRVADAATDPRAADPTMPLFHFVPWPFDWCALSCCSLALISVLLYVSSCTFGCRMNDSNGPMYDPVHDMYHLFYQYQTPRMWGHAASRDLVDWEQLPMALTRQRSYDEHGDFSGSATVLDDAALTPVIRYDVHVLFLKKDFPCAC
jgi:hypothetical protein